MIPRRVVKTAGCSLLAALLLASCAGLIWYDSGYPGALVEGNRRPNMTHTCHEISLAIADSKYCEHAFLDHNGRKLRVDEDVVDVIDAYLPNIPSLSSWTAPNKSSLDIPYRLYLLTISPIVVMGVPANDVQRRVCGTLSDGCLRSLKLSGFRYRFGERPQVGPGSFWFSPDLKTPEQQIANGAQNVVIPLRSSRLDLTSDGKNWEVRRNSQ